MEEIQAQKLTEFCNITGTAPENGKFFLESARWNIELALANFFDLSVTALIDSTAEMDSDSKAATPGTYFKNEVSASKKTKSDNTMANANVVQEASVSNSTSPNINNDIGQAFFAGGSVSSGQQILGPPSNTASVIMDMFHTAKKSFFAVGDPTVSESSFQGQGRRLDSEESQEVEGDNNEQNLVDMVLRVWSNGFTVDEGPLRNIENPRDREFLHLLTTGQVPPEIVPGNRTLVRLKVEDHKSEIFKKHQKKQVPFSGQGHVLGSDAPETSDQDLESHMETEEYFTIPIDKNLPVTTVQLRLTDGRRVKVRLNHSHTIGDLRNYITTLGPQYSSGNFRLLTSFPSKELNDNNVTVEQAGILNSLVLLGVK